MANIVKIHGENDFYSLIKQEAGFAFSEEAQIPSWLPAGKKSGEISVSILRSDINPWRTSLFQSGHLSAVTRNGLLMSVLYMTANPRNSAMPLKVKIAKEIHGGTYGN